MSLTGSGGGDFFLFIVDKVDLREQKSHKGVTSQVLWWKPLPHMHHRVHTNLEIIGHSEADCLMGEEIAEEEKNHHGVNIEGSLK